MTYAERFKVRTWLEEPAKWLSWAIDSSGNITDAAWNLQQFWKALEPLKSSNRSAQQWGEILLLDSRAQSTLGHHLLLKAALQAKTAAVTSVDAAWIRAFVMGLGPATALPKVREFLAKNDPALRGYQAAIRQLHDQAQQAFQKGAQMAEQSQKALASAQASTVQAERAQTAAKSGQVITLNSRGQTAAQILDAATNAGPQLDIPGVLTTSLGGVPLWLWAAAGVALALTLSAGPTVVAVDRARRMAA